MDLFFASIHGGGTLTIGLVSLEGKDTLAPSLQFMKT